jgi:hypothetical protein
LNNLDRFFDSRYPSLATKFGAFITWISTAGLLTVKTQITFMSFRRLMETAAAELAAHPNDKLLAKYLDAPGARQVERLFKPASFSLETTPSPSPTASSRKRRLNMNVSQKMPSIATPMDNAVDPTSNDNFTQEVDEGVTTKTFDHLNVTLTVMRLHLTLLPLSSLQLPLIESAKLTLIRPRRRSLALQLRFGLGHL